MDENQQQAEQSSAEEPADEVQHVDPVHQDAAPSSPLPAEQPAADHPAEPPAAESGAAIQNSAATDQGSVAAEVFDDWDATSLFGVPGLTRAQIVRDGFSIWHLNMPDLTTSDALISGALDPAAEHILAGDVAYITTADGVLHRSLLVKDGTVQLLHLA